MDKSYLEQKYLVEHLTLDEIGKELGCSRQNVYAYVKKYGIDARKAEWAEVECAVCGKKFEVRRKRFRRTQNQFCSMEHYKVYLTLDEYKEWRQGQRIARLVVEQKRGYALQEGEVVHHKDGNNENNDYANLMVFPSHSEHLKFHHAEKRKRLNETRTGTENSGSSGALCSP